MESPKGALEATQVPYDDLGALRRDYDYSSTKTNLVTRTRMLTAKEAKVPFAASPNPDHNMKVLYIEHDGKNWIITRAVARRIPRAALAVAEARVVVMKPDDELAVLWMPHQRPGKARNSWSDSVLEIVKQNQNAWIQLKSNQRHGRYEVAKFAADRFELPQWPAENIYTIVNTSMPDRLVDHMDHPAVKAALARHGGAA